MALWSAVLTDIEGFQVERHNAGLHLPAEYQPSYLIIRMLTAGKAAARLTLASAPIRCRFRFLIQNLFQRANDIKTVRWWA